MDDQAWAWLAPALNVGTERNLGRSDIEAGLAKGELALWRAELGAAVTYFVEMPEGRCLHIWLAGGAMGAILSLRVGAEAWARGHGAKTVSLKGRPGWHKLLKPYGYSKVGEELIKTL